MSKVKLMSVMLLCCSMATLQAATVTWDGSSSVNWADGANWDTNTPPTTGDDVVLTGAGGFRPTNQDIATLSLNSLTFDATTTTVITVVGTGTLTLTGTGTVVSVNAAAGNHTLQHNVTLGSTGTWDIGAGRTFTVSGIVAQSGTQGIIKAGTGNLVLKGQVANTQNAFTGMSTVNAGQLQVGGNYGGDGGLKGNVTVNSGGVLALLQGNIVNNSVEVIVNGTGSFNINGQAEVLGSVTGNGQISNSNPTGNTLTLDNYPTAKVFSGTVAPVGTGGPITLAMRGAVSSAGSWDFNNATVTVAAFNLARGTVNILGTTNVNCSGLTNIANNFTAGATTGAVNATLNVTSGTFSCGRMDIGDNNTAGVTAVGVVNVNGGTLNCTGTAQTENAGLRIGHYPTGTGTVNLSSGTLTVGNNTEIACAVDGTGTFNQTGGTASANTVDTNTRTGNATGNGTFRVQGGTFNLGAGGIIRDATGNGTVLLGGMGGTLNATATATMNQPAALSGTGANAIALSADTGVTLTASGVLSGTDLRKSGEGTVTLTAANTYTGATTVNAGILRAGASTTVFGDNSAVTLANTAGVTLDLNNFNVSIGSLAGGGTTGGNVTLGSGTLTTGGNNTNTAYSGVISGTSGALTKIGTGTQTLSGANTYTGSTAINAGTLTLNWPGSTSGGTIMSSSSISMNPGTTLNFNPVAQSNAGNSGTNAYTFNGPINLTGGAGTATITFAKNDTKYLLGGNVTGAAGVAQTLAIVQGGSSTGAGDRQNILFSGVIADGSGGGTLGLNIDFAGASGTGQSAYVNLSGQNTFTGPIAVTNSKGLTGGAFVTIGGERWSASHGSGAQGSGFLGGGNYTNTISLATGITLGYFSTANQTLGGIVSGTGSILKEGSGTLTVSGANTYTGTTTVNTGTLKAGSTSAFGTNSAVTLANTAGTILDITGFNNSIGSLAGGGATGGNVTLGAATLTAGGNNSTTTYSGVISGTGGLTKAGTGTLTLNGANTFNGGVNLTGGIVTAGTNTALGSGTFTFSASAIRLVVNDGLTIANNIIIGANAGAVGRGLIENSGTGNATLSGGTMTINNGAAAGGHFAGASTGSLTINHPITSSVAVVCRIGIVVLGGGGSYTNFTIGQGTVRLSANNGIATNATANIASSGAGNLDLAGFNQSLVGMTKGANTAIIGNSSTTVNSTLTVTGTSTYAGIIQNVLGSGTRTVALTVNSSGTLTLSGANTYSGATTVTAGTLALTNTAGSATGTGNVTVASGATLGGTGTVTGAVTVNGIVAPGLTGTNGALTLSGNVAFNAGSSLSMDLDAAGVSDSLNAGGTVGTVTLNPTATLALNVTNTATGAMQGQSFTLINNTTAGAIVGTFSALEGATLLLSNRPYLVTYVGGTGSNDCRLTDDGPDFTGVATNTSQTIDEGAGLAALVATVPGGMRPLTFSLISGALPPGITLNSNGTFSGVTDGTSAGAYAAVLRVTDDRGAFDQTTLNITVVDAGFAVADISIDEGAGTVTITVTRVGAAAGAASVQAGTSSGTATAGVDFTTTSATLNWGAGVAGNMTFTVPILEDAISEGSETFTITLLNPVGAFVIDGTATVTITDNETLPSVSVVDGSVAEAAGTASVTVTLTGTSSQAVTVDLTTTPGTATAGVDFTPGTTTVTWLAGESGPKTVSVPVLSDVIDEADETVTMTLGNVSATAVIGDGSGVLTILDDDTPPLAVNDSFGVGLNTVRVLNVLGNDSGLANVPITVSVVTPPANGTLTVNADNTISYTPATGYLGADSFVYRITDSVGQTSVATVTITVTPGPVFVSQPTLTPNPAVAGALVQATAATDSGTIVWAWGDGTAAGSGASTSHVYAAPGNYTVTVTATSPDGAMTVTSLQVFVSVGLDGGAGIPGGGATPPGVTGILVGGAGAGAAQGGSGKVSCNYVRRDKTYYQGSIAQLALPATLKQSDLALQFGTLVIGTGASAKTFRFDLDERGRGKSTGLPKIEFNVAKKRFKFKAQREDLTALTEALGAPQQFVKTTEPVTLLVPVTVQVGNKLYLALTFQLRYKQISGKGTGGL